MLLPLLWPPQPAGKTYTMLGSDETAGEWSGAPGRDEARGLIQRVFEHLFARMAEAGGKHLLECSFLEIYNEARKRAGLVGAAAEPGWAWHRQHQCWLLPRRRCC